MIRVYEDRGRRPAELARRYRAELDSTPGAPIVERLRALAFGHGRLVLLTATRDVERSGAAMLRDVLATQRGT